LSESTRAPLLMPRDRAARAGRTREGRDLEVDRPVGRVGVAVLLERAESSRHRRNVIGRARRVLDRSRAPAPRVRSNASTNCCVYSRSGCPALIDSTMVRSSTSV
jgi:hypothetical protein